VIIQSAFLGYFFLTADYYLFFYIVSYLSVSNYAIGKDGT